MAFFHPIKPKSCVFRNKTLVIPVVSTANVPQLAVDLLISSLTLVRVGIFDPKDVVPVVGGREEGQEDGVTTPLELYGKDGADVFLIQQRSPALKSQKENFVSSVLNFVAESGFNSVIFLSGCDLTNRTDAQMVTPIYIIHPPRTPDLTTSRLTTFTHVPVYTSPQHSEVPRSISSDDDVELPFIPGGGLTRRFLSSISHTDPVWSVPTVCLVQFVVEGDNRADAMHMARVLARLLALEDSVTEWRQPESWKQGLFGTPQDQTLFG